MTRFGPLWFQQGNYPAQQDRMLIAAIWPYGGTTGMQASATTGMVVQMSQGHAAILINARVGALCTSNAAETVTIGAAHATLPRIDLIVCQVRAQELGDPTNNDWIFQVVPGTAAASPTAPAVPANAIAIAEVAVAAGASSIVAANLTDRRPRRLDQPYNTAWGCVASATATANQTGIATGQNDLTNLLAEFQQVAFRRYLVTLYLPQVAQQTAQGTAILYIKDDGNQVKQQWRSILAAGAVTGMTAQFLFAPTVNGYRAFRGAIGTSAGTVDVTMSGTQPGTLTVLDVGPAPGSSGTLFDWIAQLELGELEQLPADLFSEVRQS